MLYPSLCTLAKLISVAVLDKRNKTQHGGLFEIYERRGYPSLVLPDKNVSRGAFARKIGTSHALSLRHGEKLPFLSLTFH